MRPTNRLTSTWPSILMLSALWCLAQPPAIAAEHLPQESDRLAALARQIDLIDRLAEHAASVAPQERTRYHFDYVRLRADLQRVRAGLQDYLVPQRAQPRDAAPLSGEYLQSLRDDSRPDTQQEAAP